MADSYKIPESESLERVIRTALEEAIYDVLGGPVPASDALHVTRQAIHGLLDSGAVRSRATALRIQDATRAKGREVPAAELMELVPWHGPERHGGGSGSGNGKPRRPPRRASTAGSSRSGTLHSAPTPAMAVGWS